MKGKTPPRIRYIKPYRYTVQPGDSVGTITGLFGMPVGRWPELCGANLHKALADEPPQGFGHRCFRQLSVGESLSIPADWSEPYGSVGAPLTIGTIDTLAAFQSAVQSAVATLPALAPIASAFGADLLKSVSAVVFAWWPYLSKVYASIPRTPPTSTSVLADVIGKVQEANWAALFISANEFLKQTGIGQGDSPTVQNVPWGDIPWTQLTGVWTQVQPQVWSSLSTVLASLPGTTAPHTTQPTVMSGSMQLSGDTPNFFDPATWSSPTYKSVPFADLTWSEMLTEVVKDPRFVKCSTEHPERLAKLKDCKQCYTNATEFVDRLCTTDADPCDCGKQPEPDPPKPQPEPEPEPGKSEGMSTAMKVGIGVVATVAVVAVVASIPEDN